MRGGGEDGDGIGGGELSLSFEHLKGKGEGATKIEQE